MTEKKAAFQRNPEGQPAEPAPEPAPEAQPAPQQQPAGNEQPVYVTRADLDAAITDIRRSMQSMTGKAEARIQKQLEALQRVGIQATPEQVQKLVDAAEAEAEAQPQPEPSTRQPAQAAAQGGGDDLDPVNRDAYEMLKEAGIDPSTVGSNDPDISLINTTGTPRQYLKSIEAYIAAVKKRQEGAGSPARIPTLAGPGAQAPNQKETITRELETLLRNPTKNAARIKELSGQLSKLK